MSFTSINFLVFFGILIILYYALPKKIQWIVLLVASYAFYLFAGLKYLGFILFTTITTYLVTRYMDGRIKAQNEYLKEHKAELSKEDKKAYKKQVKSRNRLWFILTIVVNFGILFFCKACLVDPLHSMTDSGVISFLSVGLPFGISFYMFQSMGYVIDVYRGKAEAENNFFKVALFVSFFPQLVQGPISKWEQLKESLFAPHPFDRRQVAFGLQRMLWGFFKKLVIADRIAVAIGTLKGTEYTGVSFFLLTVFYAVQIYGDFTGGIDIAIGVGETLGVIMPENFIRPYFSKNIAEYWRRWHISLNEWMKSYIFYPITVSGPMLKLALKTRKSLGKFGMRIPVYIGSLLTWLGTGVWHGFNLHFIVWGLMNCFVIVISEELNPLYEKFHQKYSWSNTRGYNVFQILRMFVLMNLIRASDLFNDVGDYFRRMGSLAWQFNFHVLWDGTLMNLGLNAVDYVILIAGIVLMFLVSFFSRDDVSFRVKLQKIPWMVRYLLIFLLLLAVILFGSYGIGYDASNFIYNQF
ncbi:MAG: MBOAT family protein [Parasporobacterium sp.]|nr:MBOAT family protein [Parasporobacterium sp.]